MKSRGGGIRLHEQDLSPPSKYTPAPQKWEKNKKQVITSVTEHKTKPKHIQ